MESPDRNGLNELCVSFPLVEAERDLPDRTASYDGGGGRRLALAKWVLANRRRRIGRLKHLRLGEPTWDMILDLYIADREKRRVDVSGMCLGSGVPTTTALRYVDLLIDEMLITKVPDPTDGRRAIIKMGAELRQALDDWLDQASASLDISGL